MAAANLFAFYWFPIVFFSSWGPFQMSGLPLEISVKFQINMAMRDVSNMAHVDRFSNSVVPLVWFEIVSISTPSFEFAEHLHHKILMKFVSRLDLGKTARRTEKPFHALHQYIAGRFGSVSMGSFRRWHHFDALCDHTRVDAIVVQLADIAQNIETTTEIQQRLSGHHSTAQRIGQSVRIEREATKEQCCAERCTLRHRHQLRKDIHVGRGAGHFRGWRQWQRLKIRRFHFD